MRNYDFFFFYSTKKLIIIKCIHHRLSKNTIHYIYKWKSFSFIIELNRLFTCGIRLGLRPSRLKLFGIKLRELPGEGDIRSFHYTLVGEGALVYSTSHSLETG